MFNYLNDHIKAGDEMTVLPPMGNFNLKTENTQRHIVLIGCGSGITPLFSMAKSVLVEELVSTVSLVYVKANKENTIFYDELEKWSARFPTRFRIAHYWGDVVKSELPEPDFSTGFLEQKIVTG